MSERELQIDGEMMKVYPNFRIRWCESNECWCLGCVNRSQFTKFKDGITKEEWLAWKSRSTAPTAGGKNE